MFIPPKKITAFGFLLLVAIPLFFSVAVLIKQINIHSLREERLNTEWLQTITVLPGEFHWVKPDREVMIDGKLFDVKSYITEGSNVLLTGFFDEKEDNLVNQIKDLEQQKNRSTGSLSHIAVTYLFSITYTNHSEITYEGDWKFISQQYYLFDEMLLNTPALSLIHPPRS